MINIKHPYLKQQVSNLNLDQLTSLDNISIQIRAYRASNWLNISQSTLNKIIKLIDQDLLITEGDQVI